MEQVVATRRSRRVHRNNHFWADSFYRKSKDGPLRRKKGALPDKPIHGGQQERASPAQRTAKRAKVEIERECSPSTVAWVNHLEESHEDMSEVHIRTYTYIHIHT